MHDYPDELGKIPADMLWSVLNINMGSVTMMTRMLINDMKKRGKGAIVNISSGSELQPLPYAAVYAASKVNAVKYVLFIVLFMDLFAANHSFILELLIFRDLNLFRFG